MTNFDRATDKIMEVFNDPIFAHDDGRMELEEIDFWRTEGHLGVMMEYTLLMPCFLREGGRCGGAGE